MYINDLIGEFLGEIGYKTLDYKTIDEKTEGVEEDLKITKKYIINSRQITINELNSIVQFYESRLNKFKQNPVDIKQEMSVSNLQVFIVKGTKKDNVVSN